MLNVVVTLLVGLLIVLAVGVVSALLLGLGTLLALVFAVSVWEATLIAVAVTAGLGWLLLRTEPAPLDAAEDEPIIVVPDLPLPPLRGVRRRRRP